MLDDWQSAGDYSVARTLDNGEPTREWRACPGSSDYYRFAVAEDSNVTLQVTLSGDLIPSDLQFFLGLR